MNLKTLKIERAAAWRDNAGELCGEVTFDNPDSELTLRLTPDMAHAILDVCADALAAQAAEASRILRGNILTAALGGDEPATAERLKKHFPLAAEEGGVDG